MEKKAKLITAGYCERITAGNTDPQLLLARPKKILGINSEEMDINQAAKADKRDGGAEETERCVYFYHNMYHDSFDRRSVVGCKSIFLLLVT